MDVEGIPVSVGPDGVWAHDGVVPRPFPAESASRNGAVVSPEAFDALRASFRTAMPSAPKLAPLMANPPAWAQQMAENLGRGIRNNTPTG